MNGKMIILACVTGFLLDCIFGDPAWMYHPIRVIGNLISVLEKGLRKLLCSRIPASEQKKKNKREVLTGGILWILTVSLSFLVPAERFIRQYGFFWKPSGVTRYLRRGVL